ncbi:hypothetical protein KFE25_009170 [Diacronema lutheri]|uniref:Uncharacterized protein n=1 Tax=Diacronema lutheri TaxID=2081491 RepID=A0A8J5Y4H4_DIALT|nr:hypothetical protein KFE25_009170 [Diacronema lutheri]
MRVNVQRRNGACGVDHPTPPTVPPERAEDGGSGVAQANHALALGLKDEGSRHFAAGRYTRAAASFSAALKVSEHGAPLQATLLSNRSAAYLQWSQPALAAADAQAAVVFSPREPKPYFRLARALIAMALPELAAYVCGEWAERECGDASARQRAQLRELREAALARVSPDAQPSARGPLSVRVCVRSQRSRHMRSLSLAAGAATTGAATTTRVCEILTAGDGGVLLQTLANVLHIPRARLKVVCDGKVLKDAHAAELVRAAAARAPSGRPLVLHALGEPSDDESDVDARSVEAVCNQLQTERHDAVARLRAARGDLLDALLL